MIFGAAAKRYAATFRGKTFDSSSDVEGYLTKLFSSAMKEAADGQTARIEALEAQLAESRKHEEIALKNAVKWQFEGDAQQKAGKFMAHQCELVNGEREAVQAKVEALEAENARKDILLSCLLDHYLNCYDGNFDALALEVAGLIPDWREKMDEYKPRAALGEKP